jgi:hypothetical protein
MCLQKSGYDKKITQLSHSAISSHKFSHICLSLIEKISSPNVLHRISIQIRYGDQS